MSRVIWKFEVPRSSYPALPAGARVLSAGEQDGLVFVWADVDPAAVPTWRALQSFCTGDRIPDGAASVGTVHMTVGPNAGTVLHVYDGGTP